MVHKDLEINTLRADSVAAKSLKYSKRFEYCNSVLPLILEHLRCVVTPYFSAIFTKGNNLSDFPFVSLDWNE